MVEKATRLNPSAQEFRRVSVSAQGSITNFTEAYEAEVSVRRRAAIPQSSTYTNSRVVAR